MELEKFYSRKNDELSYSFIRKEKDLTFKSNIEIKDNPLLIDFVNFEKNKNIN